MEIGLGSDTGGGEVVMVLCFDFVPGFFLDSNMQNELLTLRGYAYILSPVCHSRHHCLESDVLLLVECTVQCLHRVPFV